MESKNQKTSHGGSKQTNIDYDPRSDRKAVIIADTYTNLLSPIKDEISEVLLPVCNVPIIEYLLDFLFSNSISEIIICSSKNSETLRNYLKRHFPKSNNIKLIVSDEFQDMGDCIRKINSEKLITNDFVLVRGLIIANFNLEKAFDYHLAKKKEDPYVILTSIMKKYKNDKFVKTKYDENFMVVNKNTNQILQYESLRDSSTITLNENVKLTLSKPKSGNEQPSASQYEIKTNLFDSFIDICAPDVLNHFADNFDYHSIRDDLYRNIIVNEIFSDKFILYALNENDYLGIVKNFESYLKVNLEIINRWGHPITLENLHISAKLKTSFKVRNPNIYTDGANVFIDSKVKNLSSAVLGSEAKIGEFSEVTGSVIGKEVSIGKKCKIKNSIIMEGVSIKDDVVIENSIIGKNVEIQSKCVLKNCYVANNLVLNFAAEEESPKVIENMRIKLDLNNDSNLDASLSDESSDLYGDGNNDKDPSGRNESTRKFDNDKNDEEILTSDKNITKLEMLDNETFLMNLEDRDYMFTCIDKKETCVEDSNINDIQDDMNELDDDFTESEQEEQEVEENFEDEMKIIVQSGIDDPDKISDIVQEIMALKFSFKYKTFSDSNHYFKICLSFYLFFHKNLLYLASISALHPIFSDFIDRNLANSEKIGRSHLQSLLKLLQNWDPFLQRIVPSEKEKLELIAVIEDLCSELEKLRDAFHIIIQYLNSELKVIDEKTLIDWSQASGSSYVLMEGYHEIDPSQHKKFVEKLEKYISQLSS